MQNYLSERFVTHLSQNKTPMMRVHWAASLHYNFVMLRQGEDRGHIMTNAQGMYPGYQRLFLAYDDYN